MLFETVEGISCLLHFVLYVFSFYNFCRCFVSCMGTLSKSEVCNNYKVHINLLFIYCFYNISNQFVKFNYIYIFYLHNRRCPFDCYDYILNSTLK